MKGFGSEEGGVFLASSLQYTDSISFSAHIRMGMNGPVIRDHCELKLHRINPLPPLPQPANPEVVAACMRDRQIANGECEGSLSFTRAGPVANGACVEATLRRMG